MKNILVVFLLGLSFQGLAQDKYWVYYTDKDSANFDPYEFFDAKAIERRILNNIPLSSFSDWPVTESYSGSVKALATQEKVVSRWFNASCVIATAEQIELISNLPFVRDIQLANPMQLQVSGQSFNNAASTSSWDGSMSAHELKFLDAQIRRMKGEEFIAKNIDGKGVRIAVFDIGFESWKTNPAFEHLRARNQILKTYDFVKKRENVDGYHTHGTFVLSCIAGVVDGKNIGLATGAEFILARTETWTEFYAEEENWLAAAEWADKEGAHIINSSLGYTKHRYFREQMTGNYTTVTKAANMAASKGILVVNAAGNDGDNSWKIIGAPADSDSVLSIGGLNPKTGYHTNFSSFGPTRNFHLKPNVSAYGHVMGSSPSGMEETQGTSFSSPLVAGFAACAKQSRPGYKTMALFKEIEKSGDLFPYFDYAHGYGVPQASYFIDPKRLPKEKYFKLVNDQKKIFIDLNDSSQVNIDVMYDIEKEELFEEWPPYVFYHIENDKGYLDKYFLVDPHDYMRNLVDLYETPESIEMMIENGSIGDSGPMYINKSDYDRPFTLRVFYKGQFEEIKIK